MTEATTVEVTEHQKTIAKAICTFASTLVGDFDQQAANSAAANAARDSAKNFREGSETGKRIPLLVKAAALAQSKSWDLDDIKTAAKLARKLQQGSRADEDPAWRTMNVFISEMTTVIHPTVRKNFKNMTAAVQKAWDAEKELPKDQPHPIQKYKGNVYKLVIDISRKTRDNAGKQGYEINITKPEDVTAYAIANDPATVADSIRKRCAAIAKQVQAMHQEFHYTPFKTIVDYLTASGLADALELARKEHEASLANASKQGLVKTGNKPKTNGVLENAKPANAAAGILKDQLDEEDKEDEEEDNDNSLGITNVNELMDGISA